MVSVKSNIGRSAYGIIAEDDKNSQPRGHTMDKGFGVVITRDNDISVADITREDMQNSFILVNYLGLRLFFNYYANGVIDGKSCPFVMLYGVHETATWEDLDSLNPHCLRDLMSIGAAVEFANNFLQAETDRDVIRLIWDCVYDNAKWLN